jgi:hypothetical protein
MLVIAVLTLALMAYQTFKPEVPNELQLPKEVIDAIESEWGSGVFGGNRFSIKKSRGPPKMEAPLGSISLDLENAGECEASALQQPSSDSAFAAIGTLP